MKIKDYVVMSSYRSINLKISVESTVCFWRRFLTMPQTRTTQRASARSNPLWLSGGG